MRWGVAIALVALLAGGGALAVMDLSSPGPATAGSGQAAALNTILSSASSPALRRCIEFGTRHGRRGHNRRVSRDRGVSRCETRLTPPRSPRTPPYRRAGPLWPGAAGAGSHQAPGSRAPAGRAVVGRFCRSRLVRLRALGGMHGQFTFKTKSGPRTIAFARGVLESVTAGQVVVKSADGTTWTWDLRGQHGGQGAGQSGRPQRAGRRRAGVRRRSGGQRHE